MSLLDALTQAVLPVLAIATAGYALGRIRDVDAEPLATITIYVLTPALVFHSLAITPIGGETAVKLAVGVTAFTLAMVAIAAGVACAAGHPTDTRGAMILATPSPTPATTASRWRPSRSGASAARLRSSTSCSRPC